MAIRVAAAAALLGVATATSMPNGTGNTVRRPSFHPPADPAQCHPGANATASFDELL